jgi:dipeptidase D
MDIHKGLGNANKIMNSLLMSIEDIIQISEIKGGSLRNAIPRESFATVVSTTNNSALLISEIEKISNILKDNFVQVEPNIEIEVIPVDCPNSIMDKETQAKLIRAIDKAHNGVYKMSDDIPDLVEASNNIAKVNVAHGLIQIECLTRSSLDISKKEVSDLLTATFENEEFEVKLSGSYPGWQPNSNSPILKVMEELYENIFDQKAKVVACHAGLECGILGTNYPDMDMISFGPTIQGAHSPDERASISSVQKFWKYLLEILKNIPNKEIS